MREDFRDEDLAAARKAVSQSLAALNKARASESAADSANGQDKQPTVALAEAKHALAQADLASLEARWAADFAKYAQPPGTNADELAKAAAAAERQSALFRAELNLLQLQSQHAAAEKKSAADQDAAKAKAAQTKLEKDLTTAREALEKARAAAEKTDSNYTTVGKPFPETSTGRRLAFARWITSPANPLAARVAVNHLWLRHFGAPLVENMFDFGARSPRPELGDPLDWLAVELVEHDWSMKHLHRLMVTSNTYRLTSNPSVSPTPQSAIRTPQSLDPDNRALWHMNTRRLEAELVRDCLLYVGGSLDLSLGGPDIDQELGESSRRRSVYFRHAYEKQMQFLVLFDAANVNECYRRSESVIPQQALAIANGPLSLAQSRLLARQLTDSQSAGASDDAFIHLAFERLLSRPPTSDELATCQRFLAAQSIRLADPANLTAFSAEKKATITPASDPHQRSRENLIHVLLNHNDFVTIR